MMNELFDLNLSEWEWRMAFAVAFEPSDDVTPFGPEARAKIASAARLLRELPTDWLRELHFEVRLNERS
jgi:hypothetical protein